MIKQLECAGLVETKTALLNGVVGTELKFLPESTEFIVPFLKEEITMRWCCAAFKGRIQEQGSRGYAILTKGSENDPEFVLRSRSVEKGSEDLVSSATMLSLTTDVRIQFCPWCGVPLNKFYGAKNRPPPSTDE